MTADNTVANSLPGVIRFERSICGEYGPATRREWLVTNGIGGYASGTVSGALTRRYHGLLIAAQKPPLGRKLVVSKLDETVSYQGEWTPLLTNRWAGNLIDPHGYKHIRQFGLRGGVPVWLFEVADAVLEKMVWMEPGANTTYVRYRLLRAGVPFRLKVGVFVNSRDHHANTHAGGWQMEIRNHGSGVHIFPGSEHLSFQVVAQDATWKLRHEWARDYALEVEAYRGLDDLDDHLLAGEAELDLTVGRPVYFVCTADEAKGEAPGSAYERYRRRCSRLLQQAGDQIGKRPPPWIDQLILAADQLIVRRTLDGEAEGKTVIAGYPWFGDWGRDTMISLRGLTLATGRTEVARQVLKTYSSYVDQGMLPNHFPESGADAEYNTVDATLWYFEAIRAYGEQTGDLSLVEELFPTLVEIIDWHLKGTRHGIQADSSDGLLAAGEPGVQLTWMDAKVGDWVVTPRIGKPVEINALWHRALATMTRFSADLGQPGSAYAEKAQAVAHSFQRFWNLEKGFCFDVLDGPNGADSSLRPNQLFAISLGEELLSGAQRRAVVDICARRLYTSVGLRSLSAGHTDYTGVYGGGTPSRDGAYHQGTVWGWLIGPFVEAHYRTYRDVAAARQYLLPLTHNLLDHGLGTISEIFDGDSPHRPRGCIAQAWSVAELLRIWQLLEQHVVGNAAGSESR